MQIGSLSVHALVDAYAVLAPDAFFAGGDAATWQQHRAYLRADGQWGFPMGGYLVRTGDRLALIDVGYGPYYHPSIRSGGRLLASLAAVGVHPGDVTDVLLTHLHPDHIGWVARDGKPVFPRASYRCHAADWAHFTSDKSGNPLAAPLVHASGRGAGASWLDLLASVESRLEPWTSDGPLLVGVEVLHTPGHTPGSSTIVLLGGQRTLLVGDAVHCPAQLTEPGLCSTADFDPPAAAASREALSAILADDAALVSGPHFPDMSFGRLGNPDRRWYPVFTDPAAAAAVAELAPPERITP
jgi:glyoxylase-like metal-dependent hydrolase (beta-lactamase superfamily II)